MILSPLLMAAKRTGSMMLCAAVLVSCASNGTSAPGGSASPDLTHKIRGYASSIAIATGDWKPGDAAMAAEIRGELRLSKTDCLHMGSGVGGRGPGAIDVVWPAGYTAEQTSPGTVVVKRPDGAVVARTGRSFSTGGGYLPPTEADLPCRAGKGDVAYINAEMAPLR